jgi:hypothetical protein
MCLKGVCSIIDYFIKTVRKEVREREKHANTLQGINSGD